MENECDCSCDDENLPFRPHKVVRDFTMTDQDDLKIQVKCAKFWEVVGSRRELRALLGKADQVTEEEGKEEAEVETPKRDEDVNKLPAVHALQMMKNKGAFKAAFQTAHPCKPCEDTHKYILEKKVSNPLHNMKSFDKTHKTPHSIGSGVKNKINYDVID